MIDEGTPEARARARAGWPIRRLSLQQDQGTEYLARKTSVEQRLAMMWELAVRSWALGGLVMPDYERAAAPGRVVRSTRDPRR